MILSKICFMKIFAFFIIILYIFQMYQPSLFYYQKLFPNLKIKAFLLLQKVVIDTKKKKQNTQIIVKPTYTAHNLKENLKM